MVNKMAVLNFWAPRRIVSRSLGIMASIHMYTPFGDKYDRKPIPAVMFEPENWFETMKTVTGQAQYARFCGMVLSYMREGQSEVDEVERFLRLVGTEGNDEFLQAPVRLMPELEKKGPVPRNNLMKLLVKKVKELEHKKCAQLPKVESSRIPGPNRCTAEDRIKLALLMFGESGETNLNESQKRLLNSTIELGFPQVAFDQATAQGHAVERDVFGFPHNLRIDQNRGTPAPISPRLPLAPVYHLPPVPAVSPPIPSPPILSAPVLSLPNLQAPILLDPKVLASPDGSSSNTIPQDSDMHETPSTQLIESPLAAPVPLPIPDVNPIPIWSSAIQSPIDEIVHSGTSVHLLVLPAAASTPSPIPAMLPIPGWPSANPLPIGDVSSISPPEEPLPDTISGIPCNTSIRTAAKNDAEEVLTDSDLCESPGLTPFSHESCYRPRHSSGI